MVNFQSLPPVDKLQALRQRRARVKLAATRRKTSRAARRAHGPQNPSALEYVIALRRVARGTWNMILAEYGLRTDAIGDGNVRFKLYDFVEQEVPPLARRQAKKVSEKGAEDMKRLVGIDPRIDPGVGPTLDSFVIENVRLITKMADEQHEEIKKILDQNLGLRVEELADVLEERFGVSESRAMLIARDQTLKLASDVTRIRQTNAGIDSYVWTTSGDERVRDEHADLDGDVFTWAAGHPTEGHPGQTFQCRCTAYPVVPGLDDEAD